MNRRLESVGAAVTVCAIAGCSGLPQFNDYDLGATASEQSGAASIPKASEVVERVQCELLEMGRVSELSRLVSEHYVVTATITLEVTDDGAVNPSLSFIHALTETTKRTLGVGGQFAGQAHRTFHQEFTLYLDRHPAGTALPQCDDIDLRKGGLRGKLGIAEIVAQGLHLQDTGLWPAVVNDAKEHVPTFSSQIDFTVIYKLGVNPSWTLASFVGPGDSSPLLSYTRTNKDTVTLSFAPQGSIEGARESLNRLLLLRIQPLR